MMPSWSLSVGVVSGNRKPSWTWFNDAVKPVDIATNLDEVLIMYITIRRMEEGLDVWCSSDRFCHSVVYRCQILSFYDILVSVPVILWYSPISSSYFVIQPYQFQLFCDTALSVSVILWYSPVTSSYFVIQPCQVQSFDGTLLSLSLISFPFIIVPSLCRLPSFSFPSLLLFYHACNVAQISTTRPSQYSVDHTSPYAHPDARAKQLDRSS